MSIQAKSEAFDRALIESIDEAIRSLFSQQVVDAFHLNLKNKRSINQQDIPNSLQTLSVVFEKYFGLGSRTVERVIAQKLYLKLGIEFRRKEESRLVNYVESAKKILGSAQA